MVEQEHQSSPSQPVRDRPRMPAGYGVDPSAVEGMLPWSYVSEQMASSRNYWIVTTRPDGRPHVAPVWGIWLEDGFYFSTDPHSRKGRNIAAGPRLVVHLESGDDVVIFEGTAEEVTEASVLGRFADAYDAKYKIRPDVSSAAPGVYWLRPQVAFAWLEKDFNKTATRWLFGSH